MRILDEDNDKALSRITLYLTKAEAVELRDSLNLLLENPHGRHEHVSSSDYRKELTACIYDSDGIEEFDARSQRLIRYDIS